MDNVIWAWQFAKAHGTLGLLVIGILVLLRTVWWLLTVLMDEDRAAVVRGAIYKFSHRLTDRLDQEKKYISNDIKGRLNLARRKLCASSSVPPVAVEVVWREGGAGETHDIHEGEFIVCLDPSSAQEKNVATLATAVVKRSTLAGIRHSIEVPLQKAIDLNLVRQLLVQLRNNAALDWFLQNEYVPTIEGDAATAKRNEQIVAIDERGLFTRILLVELDDFAKRIYGKPPRPYMAGEIEGLVEFLYKIATKQFGQDVPLEFYSAFIRVAVVLVAKTPTVLRTIDPYIRAIQINLEKQAYSIYVLAFDKEWLAEADPVAHRNFEEQVARLDQEIQTGTVATRDFELDYVCVDQGGVRRGAKCIRYLAPEAE